jgi:peptidoglycan hydrolase CwlO-like protein
MADSKAGRFSSMVDTLREKLSKEENEKKTLHEKIAQLKDQIVKEQVDPCRTRQESMVNSFFF